MNRTKIEWCDYTINPVKGLCPVACPYCYARRMYKRFHWDETIRLDINSFLPLLTTLHKPAKIFVGSTLELFGPWVKPEWLNFIFARVKMLPEDTFIFLTREPQNLVKWSPFPENCWIGMTVTHNGIGCASTGAIPCFEDIEAKIKFISFEPLLGPVDFKYYTDFVDWVIIGAQTPFNITTAPKREWIEAIIEAADRAKIPVFEKNNLTKLMGGGLRQEFP